MIMNNIISYSAIKHRLEYAWSTLGVYEWKQDQIVFLADI